MKMTTPLTANEINALPAFSSPDFPVSTHGVAYLRSLVAVRQQSNLVLQTALAGQSHHFDVDLSQLPKVIDFVVSLMKRDYKNPAVDVPAHSRWRHFNVGNKSDRLHFLQNGVDGLELTRRYLDLFVVSVLLDAGAGSQWQFHEKETGLRLGRSEGLALASLVLFRDGALSSVKEQPFQVDDLGLERLTLTQLSEIMQVDEKNNPLLGLQGRHALLNRLAIALRDHKTDYFQPPSHAEKTRLRPGFMLDYLLNHATTQRDDKGAFTVRVEVLWDLVLNGFHRVWPDARTQLQNVSLGDVWPCPSLPSHHSVSHYVAFHKLSQWLTYSLMEPMTRWANIRFVDMPLMTGLAEYRNGGLFVDFEVLKLKPLDYERGLVAAKALSNDETERVPLFAVDDSVVVEWRALTVALLDRVGEQVRQVFGCSEEEMPLVRVLEGGTWKAGREIAATRRPKTRGPPIAIISDGTVF